MTTIEEKLVYDAWADLLEHSAAIFSLVEARGGDDERKAFRAGIYSAAVKIEVLLGPDGLDRGAERHKRIAAEAAFFAKKEGGS